MEGSGLFCSSIDADVDSRDNGTCSCGLNTLLATTRERWNG